MTAIGRKGCPRICSRHSGTFSARIPMNGSTNREANFSTRTGPDVGDGLRHQHTSPRFRNQLEMDRRGFLRCAGAAVIASAFPAADTATAFVAEPASSTEPGWWMTEPIRWLQTNLRETAAALNPKQFIQDVASFNANVLMMS